MTRAKCISRRQAMQGLTLCLSGFSLFGAVAAQVTLPSTESLASSLDQALRIKQPLVVMVSLHGCAFCKVVRENYLQPLRTSGFYLAPAKIHAARVLESASLK